MITISGIVKDYTSEVGISGATIFSLESTATSFFDTTTSTSGGVYQIDIPASGQAIYVPYKEGYRGYTRQLSVVVNDVDLYLRESNVPLPVSSGAALTHLVDAAITTSTDVREVKTTPCDVLAITSAGLDIFNPDTKLNKGYLVYSGGFTSLYVNPNTCYEVDVYLGTTSSGLLKIDLDENEGDLLPYLTPSYSTSSSEITCIDGNSSGALLVGTTSGVEYFSTSGSYSHLFGESVTACTLTETGEIYYSPVDSGVYVKLTPTGSWSSPDYIFNTTSTPALLSNYVNDIEVTSVVSGENNVFVATSSGLNIYAENKVTPSGSSMKSFTTELGSPTLYVSGVEPRADTTYSGGEVTISTISGADVGIVEVLDLETDSVVKVIDTLSFETSLRRTGISISGSKFLHTRGQ